MVPKTYVLIISLSIIAVFLAGCTQTGVQSATGAGGGSFQWAAENPVPLERENCPIEFFTTGQYDEVMEEASSSGKPIFCYVSKYEDYSTGEIESLVIS